MSIHLCPSPDCAANGHYITTNRLILDSSTNGHDATWWVGSHSTFTVDDPEREPPEARRLADAFEAAARSVGRRTREALAERAETLVAAAGADDAFHVDPDSLFRPEWWTDAVDAFILDVLTLEILEAGELAALDLGVAFDIVNPALERVATAHVEAIASWGQDMRTWVAGKVRQGMVDGLSVRNMTSVLLDGDSPLNPLRARRTAQTELIAGQNGANYATYTATGLTGVKTWMSSHDHRVRPEHVAVDGQERPLNEPFDVVGYPADYPAAPSLPARLRVNCRCKLTFVPADEQPPEAATLTAAATLPDGTVVYDGAMVAARVPARFAVQGPGALAPGELHITVHYLGKADIYDPAARSLVAARVQDLADNLDPFEVQVSGWGVLGPNRAVVVYVEADALAALHDQVADEAPAPAGTDRHPHYTPHFTLGYLEDGGLDVAALNLDSLIGARFTVDELLVGFGCEVSPAGHVTYGPGSTSIPLDDGDDTGFEEDPRGATMPPSHYDEITVESFGHWEHQPRDGGRFQPDYVPPSVKIAQGQLPPGRVEHQSPVTVAVEHRAATERAAQESDEAAVDEPGVAAATVTVVPFRAAPTVAPVIKIERFHMAGQHDQKTHGSGRWVAKDFAGSDLTGAPPWGSNKAAATAAAKSAKDMAIDLAKSGEPFNNGTVLAWAAGKGLAGGSQEGANFAHYVNTNMQRLKDVHYATGVLDRLPDKGEGQREVMNQVLDRLVANGKPLTGTNLDEAAKQVGLDEAGIAAVRSWSVTHATFVGKMHLAAKKKTPGADKPESPDPPGAPKKSATSGAVDETPGAVNTPAGAAPAVGKPVQGEVAPGQHGAKGTPLPDALDTATASGQWAALSPGQKKFAEQFAADAVQKIKDAGGEVSIAAMKAEFDKAGYGASQVSKGAYALVSLQPSKYGVTTKTGDIALPGATAGMKTPTSTTKTATPPTFAEKVAAKAADLDPVVGGKNSHNLPVLKGTKAAEKVSQPPINSPSKEASDALYAYHDGAYKQQNSNLRAGGKPKAADGHLTELINKHQVPDDVTVYRGIKDPKVKLKEGMVFADHGFVSTDTTGETAKGFSGGETFMVIHVPAGTKGVYKDNQHHEKELLLQRGTVFNVIGKITDPSGKQGWHVEVVSQPLFKTGAWDAKTPRYGEVEYKDAFRAVHVTL